MDQMASAYVPPTPAAPPLEEPVVVVGSQYCMPHPIDLMFVTKTLRLTEADSTVTDCNGNVVFTVKGKKLSLHDRCTLRDSVGNPLLTMQYEKFCSGHRKWLVFKGESRETEDLLFSVKKSKFWQMKTELDVCLAENTGDAPDFKIKGSYYERSCTIYLGETSTILAQMTKVHTGKNILKGNDMFGVKVYQDVDYTFVVALIIVLYQINLDRLNSC